MATTPSSLCLKCHAPLGAGEKFCGECGEPLRPSVRPPPPPPAGPGSQPGKCPQCGAVAGKTDLFCGECGAALRSAAASVNAPPPSPPVRPPGPPPPPQLRRTSVIRILLGIALGLLPLVALVAIATLAILLHNGYWNYRGAIEAVVTLLMITVFLFGFCLASLFPRIYLGYLFLSIIWIVGGWVAVKYWGTGLTFWPDWTFASGISTLIGATIGFVVSKIARRFRAA